MAMSHSTTGSELQRAPGSARSNLIRLPVPDSDAAIASSLRSDPERGRMMLYDRYAKDVDRTLSRLLGPDSELTDLLHEVFLAAMSSIDTLKDDRALGGWLIGIAVFKVRRLIRWRKVRRLVKFITPFELDERAAHAASAEVSEAVRQVYVVLEQLPTEERIAFTLRRIDGMELGPIAQATGVSLATVKRRLVRAQAQFLDLASQNEALAEWVQQGTLQP